jgi:hypothetical protein
MTTDGSSVYDKAREIWRTLIGGRLLAPLQYLDMAELPDDPAYSANRLFCRDGLNYYNGYEDVILQVGREQHVDVVNKSGGTLANGTPVCLTTGGGSRRIAVTTYPNTDIRSLFTIGLATHEIAQNQNGIVTTFGFVGDLNTSGYNVNDPVYLGETEGTLRVGVPAGTSCRVFVGFVTTCHPNFGEIAVSMVRDRPIAFEADADPYKASNRPTSPVVGWTGYDIDEGAQIVYNGSAWVNVDGSAL